MPSFNVYPDQKSFLDVEDVQLSYATKDIYGAVTDAYLDLKGYLSPVHLSWNQDVNSVEGTMETAVFWSSGPRPGSFPVLLDCSNHMGGRHFQVRSTFVLLYTWRHRHLQGSIQNNDVGSEIAGW
jgi:hypothetical protein